MNEHSDGLGELGEVLDALVSTDYTSRGASRQLYRAARERFGAPLTLGAARLLRERVTPGRTVVLASGWPSRSWLMRGLTETDGPVGTGYLARVVEQTLGCVPIFATHPDLVGFAEAALASAGLIVTDIETAHAAKSGQHRAAAAAVLPLSADWDQARQESAQFFDTYDPAAVIAIEMPGASDDYEFHNVTGRLVPTDLVAKADVLVQQAHQRGVLTIGVGDGGNELGMGYIKDALAGIVGSPPGTQPSTDVDILVAAVVSNWGAVGIGAALAALAGKPSLLRTVDLERITQRLSDAGAIDGLSAYVDPKNDGASQRTTAAFVELVASSVEMHLDGWQKG